MAANMFIQISDIPGDAIDSNHKDWIVIQSMFFEMERPVDMNGLGKNQRVHTTNHFQKIEVTSQMGIASNLLALSVANGTVRPRIEVQVCRQSNDASKGLEAFSIWVLKNAIIDNYSVSFNEDGVPEEAWTIAYTEVEHKYKGVDRKTGQLGKSNNEFKWNLREDKLG